MKKNTTMRKITLFIFFIAAIATLIPAMKQNAWYISETGHALWLGTEFKSLEGPACPHVIVHYELIISKRSILQILMRLSPTKFFRNTQITHSPSSPIPQVMAFLM